MRPGPWVLAAAALAGGCLARPALAPATFTIDPAPSSAGLPRAGGRVLCLRRLSLAPQLEGRALVYRVGDHRIERDPYARFAAPPAELLAATVRAYLRRAPFVEDVIEPGDERAADVEVEVHVQDFSGDLRPGAAAAVVRLRFLAFPARAGEGAPPLFDREYARRLPLARRSADAVVAGLNQGVAEIMAELPGDLAAALARAPVGPSPGGGGPG